LLLQLLWLPLLLRLLLLLLPLLLLLLPLLSTSIAWSHKSWHCRGL